MKLTPVLVLSLLLFGCGKTAPAPEAAPAPAASGTFTDVNGTAYPVRDLRATATATYNYDASRTIQRVNVYGTLPDGRLLTAGLCVALPVLPSTPGALPMGDIAHEIYYFKALAPGQSESAYGVFNQSSGTLTLVSTGPNVLSGTYTGPVRPANNGPATANAPKVKLTFQYLPVTP